MWGGLPSFAKKVYRTISERDGLFLDAHADLKQCKTHELILIPFPAVMLTSPHAPILRTRDQ